MKTKYESIWGQPDIKGSDGLWLRSYKSAPYVLSVTRSSQLWNSLVGRTKLGGKPQQDYITYKGCENHFIGYQEFTDWCQDQYGYMFKESNGYFWQLDKDILVMGNRIYSPETCMFVPCRVNNLLLTRQNFRGEYPLGVYKHGTPTQPFTGRFSSEAQVKSRQFASVDQAHKFWQQGKIDSILKMADTDKEIVKHIKLRDALYKHAELISEDLRNNRQTTRT